MAFQDFLATLLNPGGVWSLGGPENRNRLAAAGSPLVADQGPAIGAPVAAPVAAPAMPAPEQEAPAAPSGGGFFDGIRSLFDGGETAEKNHTIGWLKRQGLDDGTAIMLAEYKPALQKYLLDRTKGNGPTEFDQRAAAARQYGIDPSTPEGRNFILTGKMEGAGDGMTSDQKEYQYAVQQGFKGSFMDFMVKMKEAGRNQVNIDTGVKLPTGYQWVDPNDQNKGVQPIPGGPATQIPSEAAGRIGLADSFLANFDDIKKKVAAGQVTGPIDRFRATNDSSSEGAETYRQIQTGVDSLQRMLTGAGMPASEAQVYAFRYLPTYTDDAKSMVTKLDRLKSELESVQAKVLQGRGGATPSAPEKPTETDAPPASYTGDPKLWKYLTPEQRKLWQ